MYLVVTIDTEEDNWGEYQRPSFSVENIQRIPRLQDVFNKRGIRPTYLITYPVATSPLALDILGRYHEQGLCEIGTHPHPWNTPPVEEALTARTSFISNLPAALQYRKLKTLHDTITRNFGAAPTSYRSGRWGFSDDVAVNLIRLGYKVDSSISPLSDWSEYGGNDYSNCSLEPFVYRCEALRDDLAASLLEVPATIDFVQQRRNMATSVHRALVRRVPFGGKILAVLSRLRILNHVAISPETHSAEHMIRLTKALMHRGTGVVNMFFHSPSLLENCSPFVKTPADVQSFIARIDRFAQFAEAAGLQVATLSELSASAVGASEVRRLRSVPSPA